MSTLRILELGTVPRCKECTYVPDLDEWICAVCAPGRVRLQLLRLLRGLGGAPALDWQDDQLEDDDFDDDELGIDTEHPEER